MTFFAAAVKLSKSSASFLQNHHKMWSRVNGTLQTASNAAMLQLGHVTAEGPQLSELQIQSLSDQS